MRICCMHSDEWSSLANNYMNDMSDLLFLAFEKYFLTSKEVKLNDTVEIWTFSTSVFFAVTVLTTIGYNRSVINAIIRLQPRVI